MDNLCPGLPPFPAHRKQYCTRAEWRLGRLNGIGASEAAIICGISKWMTTSRLWEIKTGFRSLPPDGPQNEAIKFGVAAEPHLRGLFSAKHPYFYVYYHPFDLLYQPERPWLFCTPDAEVFSRDQGGWGLLEIKTALCDTNQKWEQWEHRIPDHYLAQVLHQFLASSVSFIYLFALLTGLDGQSVLREYLFLRSNYSEDLTWLLSQEENFWGCVQRKTCPPCRLTLP